MRSKPTADRATFIALQQPALQKAIEAWQRNPEDPYLALAVDLERARAQAELALFDFQSRTKKDGFHPDRIAQVYGRLAGVLIGEIVGNCIANGAPPTMQMKAMLHCATTVDEAVRKTLDGFRRAAAN